MFKRKKKKTGVQTPEFKKPIAPRTYKLDYGDIFVLNDVAIKQSLNLFIEDVTLGVEIKPGIICTQKIKRKHWWQFWKPKYWGAKFMYIDKNRRMIFPRAKDVFRWQMCFGEDVDISDIILDVDEYEKETTK